MRTLNRCPDCNGPVTAHCHDQHPCTWVRCLSTKTCGAFGEGDGSRWAHGRSKAA